MWEIHLDRKGRTCLWQVLKALFVAVGHNISGLGDKIIDFYLLNFCGYLSSPGQFYHRVSHVV